MAQAMVVEKYLELEKDFNVLQKTTINSSTKQIHTTYYLTNNKTVKFYKSNVYKERVVALSISSSKSFIINKEIWNKLKPLLPKVEKYLNFDNV